MAFGLVKAKNCSTSFTYDERQTEDQILREARDAMEVEFGTREIEYWVNVG